MENDLYLETNPVQVLNHFDEIISLANSESNSLGFLPKEAIKEAIRRGKLLVLLDSSSPQHKLAAYLLYSGIFPNAKVQQVATVKRLRKRGIATKLMDALVSKLENIGFITIQADVASDLNSAQKFYERNGFEKTRERSGGATRKRNIIVYGRVLDTDTLFNRNYQDMQVMDLGIRERSAGVTPFFALDLNVYFDLAKDRKQSKNARRLFGAALAHKIRLTVMDEFVKELRRTTVEVDEDPVLQLALQLPKTLKPDQDEFEKIVDQVFNLVFPNSKDRESRRKQSVSDAKHVAHAILARASGFVTRDEKILSRGEKLFRRFGIEVLSPSELLSILPQEEYTSDVAQQFGTGFRCEEASNSSIRRYMRNQGLPPGMINKFLDVDVNSFAVTRLAIATVDNVVGCSVLLKPRAAVGSCQLIIHIRQGEQEADLYIDHLLDKMLRKAADSVPTVVELEVPKEQNAVLSNVKARGFRKQHSSQSLAKIVVGRPVTKVSWKKQIKEIRLKSGLNLPYEMPIGTSAEKFIVEFSTTRNLDVSLIGLERLLAPVLFLRDDQKGVIVPITKSYSEMLIGTSTQFKLAISDEKDAAFLSRRAYVNTARSASVMRPDMPILFYESAKSGGTGGIIAVARIVQVQQFEKGNVPPEVAKRLVVENLDSMTLGDEVLVTSFENLFSLPKPVKLAWLKDRNMVDGANLVTARNVSGEYVPRIIDEGMGYE